MSESYFTIERSGSREWIVPTDLARGPWDYDSCHGGPPTAMLARALERELPHQRLCRISVELGRPVPMSGFRIETEVVRAGRASAQTRATLVDGAGKARVTAIGMHLAPLDAPLFEGTLHNADVATPKVADTEPGEFPMRRATTQWPGFRGSVEVRYPPDQAVGEPTTVYMRTVPPLPDEEPSPFQRICPLADCGNAFSRQADPEIFQFINTDLVIALHREPVGEWMGSRSWAHWQPDGVGLADALLFDDTGPVGRALQTLLLRRAPETVA